MGVPESSPPECFGDLEKVFPPGDDGLRQTPDLCMACGHKTACLRQALVDGGAARIRFERVEQEDDSSGFLRRWSARKHYFRTLEKEKKRR
jgi:hypothetical protein